MRELIRRVRRVLHWRQSDEDIIEEMVFHRAMTGHNLEAGGVDRNEAPFAARLDFQDWRLAAQSFDPVAAYSGGSLLVVA
jgi:hypothetical protein